MYTKRKCKTINKDKMKKEKIKILIDIYANLVEK